MHPATETYAIARRCFALLIGLGYAVAFAAVWQQCLGLLGADGLRPMSGVLQSAAERFGAVKYLHVPTLFWVSSADWALRAVAALGALAGLALAAGIAARWAAATAWIAYLSFVASEDPAAQATFFNWPFDLLTVEVGFLLVFLVPGGWRGDFRRETGVARIARWLARLLLFRLVLGPGVLKLAVGQDNWAHGDAVRDFLQNAPSPTGLAPPVWDGPDAVLRAATWGILVFELLGPWLLFARRNYRHTFALGCTVFMAVVFATTNVRGLPIYTSALALLCVDDRAFGRLS